MLLLLLQGKEVTIAMGKMKETQANAQANIWLLLAHIAAVPVEQFRAYRQAINLLTSAQQLSVAEIRMELADWLVRRHYCHDIKQHVQQQQHLMKSGRAHRPTMVAKSTVNAEGGASLIETSGPLGAGCLEAARTELQLAAGILLEIEAEAAENEDEMMIDGIEHRSSMSKGSRWGKQSGKSSTSGHSRATKKSSRSVRTTQTLAKSIRSARSAGGAAKSVRSAASAGSKKSRLSGMSATSKHDVDVDLPERLQCSHYEMLVRIFTMLAVYAPSCSERGTHLASAVAFVLQMFNATIRTANSAAVACWQAYQANQAENAALNEISTTGSAAITQQQSVNPKVAPKKNNAATTGGTAGAGGQLSNNMKSESDSLSGQPNGGQQSQQQVKLPCPSFSYPCTLSSWASSLSTLLPAIMAEVFLAAQLFKVPLLLNPAKDAGGVLTSLGVFSRSIPEI